MSSTESSGAPAEATATTPAPAASSSFGTTRGSGLARGKRPSTGPAPTTAASTDYTPTAIEVVSVPREYQNPFAPAETPAALPGDRPGQIPGLQQQATGPVTPVVENPAPIHPELVAEATAEAPAPVHAEASAVPASNEQAELHILEPEQQKTVPAQTWESEGFRPARESRNDRPRREESRREEPRPPERAERVPIDPASIPAKFLYVRPGYNYVPTPSNYGGAARDRDSRPAAASYPAAPAAAQEKSGGFFGWLKSLFGGTPASPAPVESRPGDPRPDGRQRGGRGRGPGGEGQGEYRGGGHRRHRGGRGRSQPRGEYRGGGESGGSPAT